MKTFIKNRRGLDVSVIVEGTGDKGKLAFVMHGLGGYKEQGYLRGIVETLLDLGYAVVSFDTTNSFGESGGDYQDATTTNYYADLEDVIGWASDQEWYVEPFVLVGHSLGGLSVALFAENYPDKVLGVAPLGVVVSGKLSLEAHKMFPELESLEKWKQDGVRVTHSHDGKIERRLKWSHMEDRLKYDLLPNVDKLTMPVLLVAGEKDNRTPPVHQQILFDKLKGPKELHIIKGAPHTLYEDDHRRQLNDFIRAWASQL
ncbi:MAG: alpha/beta hydrolase [Patescibacteria group bacterium]